MNKFNWKNFYSKENANILEAIIKEDFLSVKELSEIFCPIPIDKDGREIGLEDILSYFNELNPAQKECLTTHFSTPQRITKKQNVRLDYALKFLIQARLLPEKIYRLPRDLNRAIEMGLLPEETKHSDLIPDYYENFEAYNWVNIQPCIEPSTLLTYQELQKKLVDFSKDEILMHCINGKLGAYYRVASGKIKLETVSYNTNISELAAYNCGNPFYKTRYDGLEKLTISVLKDMRTNPTTEYKGVEHILPVLPRIFQTTDIETKLHYKRNVYCKKIEIKIENLVFLMDEVKDIEKELDKNDSIQAKSKNIAPTTIAKKEPSELVTIIVEICKKDKWKFKGERGEPQRLWNHLKNNYAGKENSLIKEMTVWKQENTGSITYFSSKENESVRRSQKLYANEFLKIRSASS